VRHRGEARARKDSRKGSKTMETKPRPAEFRSGNRKAAAALVALCLAGLIALAGCGSSGSGGTPPPPTPTPSSNGLTIFPGTASVPVGGQAVFTGYVPSQPNATVTWAVSGSSNGSITANPSGQGVYTAPSSVPSPAQVAVTATSGGFSATAVVTISAAQGVEVSPAAASIPAGNQQTFSATMNGAAATGVTWEVNGTPGGDGVHGTIDTSGNYTAPFAPPPGGSTVITAVVGSSSGTASATIVFSNASLCGAYSFAYSGDDSSGYLGVVGQFTADPASGSISGSEDVLSAAIAPATGVAINGTYSVGPDGRGSASISSTSETWEFALASGQSTPASGCSQPPVGHAVLINFGQIGTTGTATGSGTVDEQNTTGSPLAAGRYVFQLSGLDGGMISLGIAGAFQSMGSGALATTGNTVDINDGGTVLNADTSLTGSFTGSTLTLTATDFGTASPGIAATNNTLTFDYYVVGANHLRLIETDGFALMTGDVFAGPTPGGGGYTAELLQKGNYAFTLGGGTTFGPDAAGGVFTSDGGTSSTATSGSITGGVFDDNAPGYRSQTDASMSSATYSVDQNTGRLSGSMTTSAGTFNWVGYVTSPVDPANPNSVQVLLLETDVNVTASGTAYLQTATAQPTGSYALNFTGVGNKSGTEQDVVAQANISATTISGTMDINNFEVNGQQLGLNIVTSKSTVASTDSNGRGTATFTVADGASFAHAFYVVDASTVLSIEIDSQRVMTALWLKQF
jgi:hypothetical protein